ncbi:ricin B lectin domain-containing protein [Flagelloscypha sp. PMI_526]|nr:ricin B lectin domain-containing protein [Flagelloscypha sp. PMI_526]
MRFSLTILSLATLAIASPVVNVARQINPHFIKPVGHDNLCLRPQSSEVENGTEVSLYECIGNDTSLYSWYMADSGAGPIKLVWKNAAGTEFCLDAGSNLASGIRLKVWQCYDGLTQQTWVHPGEGKVKLNSFNQCMDVVDGVFNDNGGNTFVQTWTCVAGNTNQVCDPVSTNVHFIKPVDHDNLCLGPQSVEVRNGTEVSFWECIGNDTSLYTWYMADSGPGPIKLVFKDAHEYCLDAGSNPASGTRLKVWTCNGSPQQTWVHPGEGKVKLNTFNQCMDVVDGVFNNNGGNTFVQTWSCVAGNTNQVCGYVSFPQSLRA